MNPERYAPGHFRWEFADGVATITLDRPEKKNPLTFESYAELRDTFRALQDAPQVRSIVLRGANGNFCSGGDVHGIIGPLVTMKPPQLDEFTRMTGDLIVAMLTCPQIIVAAVDGVCVGAGAALAMASDVRFGTPDSKVAFLFVKVGLAGCDMGACALLPRIIGHGRAAELLYTGRSMRGDEAHACGFFNRLAAGESLHADAAAWAREIAGGPILAHRVTKRMLREEWHLDVVTAVAAEAREQARLMETGDFRRAYEAFVRRETPHFEGD
ncbi:MAG TPA: enoyl-CoA hydratase family protein [Candidatus Krumholzibacteria bacterium]|nr:enoyl-CoA hydratase family protein [Candidatus Krumholzibacteria bacterium]